MKVKFALSKFSGFATAFLFLTAVGCSNNSKSVVQSPGSSNSTNSGSSISVTAGGSTFVQPVMMKWIEAYQQAHPAVTINYQGVGSGAGISQYQAGTFDFGASDAPLSDAQLGKLGKPTILFPDTCGCEAMSYNIPGVTVPLKLTGSVIADIYLGKITKWNDPQLVALNPGVSLPSMAIIPVHRSDASGTTYIFTGYLASVSPQWKTQIGVDKSVSWPGSTAIGGKGNPGVAAAIKQTPGAIGYVEFAYVIQAKMISALVQNPAGNFLPPSLDGTIDAENASAAVLKKDLRSPIVSAPGAKSYPITGFSYILLQTNMADKSKSKALVDFFNFCLGQGQQIGETLQYAPLSKSIVALNKAELAKVGS